MILDCHTFYFPALGGASSYLRSRFWSAKRKQTKRVYRTGFSLNRNSKRISFSSQPSGGFKVRVYTDLVEESNEQLREEVLPFASSGRKSS